MPPGEFYIKHHFHLHFGVKGVNGIKIIIFTLFTPWLQVVPKPQGREGGSTIDDGNVISNFSLSELCQNMWSIPHFTAKTVVPIPKNVFFMGVGGVQIRVHTCDCPPSFV